MRGRSPRVGAEPRREPPLGSGCLCEGDGVAHGFELGDESSLPGGAVSLFIEVVTSEVVVGLPVGKEVPSNDQDRVPDRYRSALGPAAVADLGVLGRQVGVFGTRRGVSGFDEGLAEPFRSVSCSSGPVFPGGFGTMDEMS